MGKGLRIWHIQEWYQWKNREMGTWIDNVMGIRISFMQHTENNPWKEAQCCFFTDVKVFCDNDPNNS